MINSDLNKSAARFMLRISQYTTTDVFSYIVYNILAIPRRVLFPIYRPGPASGAKNVASAGRGRRWPGYHFQYIDIRTSNQAHSSKFKFRCTIYSICEILTSPDLVSRILSRLLYPDRVARRPRARTARIALI